MTTHALRRPPAVTWFVPGRPRPNRTAPHASAGADFLPAGEPWARRAFDVLFSLAALLLLAPALLLVATLIRLDSPGPALYRQTRLGRHGRPFRIVKFRSMRMDAEAAGPQWAARHDPRVTRCGRILRRTRLDELPQLLNVLAGSMSLVGPRPERPCLAAEITRAVPHFARRLLVKPGITGWAQVRLPYGASVEDARSKLACDLHYIRHRSWALDARILLDTVRVVCSGAGAR